MWKLITISLIASLAFSHVASSQTDAVATYQYYSYGDYDLETRLVINGDTFWYSNYQDAHETINDEGTEFYYYDNYFDWNYSVNTDSVLAFSKKHRYPSLYSKWKKNISWEITQEVKIINGREVQKAISKSLKKDSYPWTYGKAVAWFTSEIPFPAGPEGYHGLPGLIVLLEYTGTKNFKCELKKIEYKKIDIKVLSIKNAIEVSKGHIYNHHDIDKKWLKQQKKQLNLGE